MLPAVGYQVADVLVDGVSVGNVTSYEFTSVDADHTIHVTFEIINYEITATAGIGGTITPSGTVNVDHGTNQAFAIAAQTGYHISDVLVDGISEGVVTSYEFINVTEAHTIEAVFAINVYTLTYLAGNNGSLTGNAVQTVDHGSDGAAVTAVPDAMYHFVDWSDASTDNPRTDLDVTADLTVTANFATNTHTITATSGENGSITPTGEINVDEGTNQEFIITPDEGYYITDVLVDDISVGAVSSYEFLAINASHTIHASFAIYTYTITASAGSNGTIDPIGPIVVEYGSNQLFSMVPNEGYHIDDVLIDNISVGIPESYTFNNVTANHTISVSFAINTYTLTYLAGGNGSLVGESTQTVEHGANGTAVSAVADEFYHFVAWSDGSTENPRTDLNITADLTVTANFSVDTYLITASAGNNGIITPSGDVVVNHGASQVFIITPNENYFIDNVLVDGTSVGAVATYTFGNVTEAHTISASFGINNYTLTYLAGENGSLTGNLSQQVEHGSDGTAVTAVPDAGYLFVAWSDGSTENPRIDLNVTQDITVTASFDVDNYIITATAGNNGTIDPIGEVPVPNGSNQLFTMIPDAGYHVANVLVNGNSVGAVATYEFINVTGDQTIHVTFEINTYTITASLAGSGTIDPVGEIVVTEGENLSFSIAPAEGHYIADVTVDGQSVGAVANYTFTNITANHTIHASFTVNTYTLKYLAGNNGSISGSAIQYVNHGANGSSVTAVPDPHYHFVQWSDGSTANPRTDNNVTANITVTAEFAIDTFTVSASAGDNGTINPSGDITINYGSNLQFTMTPSPGYRVADVIVDGESIGKVNTYSFGNINANHTIHVDFEIKQYSVLASTNGNGTINPSGHIIVDYGTSQLFTMMADPGYQIEDVIVDGESVGAVNSYEFVNITTYHTIHVMFAVNYYTIMASAGANGSIDPSGVVTVNPGENQSFTITPNSGYSVADVLVDGVSVGAVSSYEFANVNANHTIAASFETITYTITASAGANGSINPSGAVTVNQGENQSFTFTPIDGYQIYAVYVDGDSIGYSEVYEFMNVMANHTIHVEFMLIIGLNPMDSAILKVNIFPVPAKHVLNIQVTRNTEIHGNLNYTIVDHKGGAIKNEFLRSDYTAVEVSGLATGLYSIIIKTDQRIIKVMKFIKIF